MVVLEWQEGGKETKVVIVSCETSISDTVVLDVQHPANYGSLASAMDGPLACQDQLSIFVGRRRISCPDR